jgi:integrase
VANRRYRLAANTTTTQVKERVTMSESNSTSSTSSGKSAKPQKPYPDFPLTAHPAGYWCKKIRGKLHYFGPWSDPDGALAKYLEQKDALHAGRKPREESEGATVKEMANRFLDAKEALVDTGELSPRTWAGYKQACDFLAKHLGKSRLVSDVGADDFEELRNKLAKQYGLHGLGTTIQCIRCVFKFAYDAGLIEAPIRFGPGFKRPSKKTLRLHRAAQGPRLFTADEIKRLLGVASVPMRAMILLGINCGFGNADCGTLPLSAVDLANRIIDFPRPKTGMQRRCPLWPETVAAIEAVLAQRKPPKSDAHAQLVFVTQRGLSWFKDVNDNPISKETRKLLNALGIDGHRNFYTLRHTFRTIADEARDQPAADFMMGHEAPHMSSHYRETISDARLKAVSDYVHTWLFPPPKKDKAEPAATKEEKGDEEE